MEKNHRKRDFESIIKEQAGAVAEHHNADVIAYCGEVSRQGYESLLQVVEAKQRPNVFLVLCTYGGDAHAGYRIARTLQDKYEKITVLAVGPCKSAGTLICLGANLMVMTDRAELGPLDVQMRKDDELLKFGSGLDIIQTLNFFEEMALGGFRKSIIDIHAGGGISTKLAGELASRLAVGLYSAVYAQLDPVRIGEVHRSMNIAHAYGVRLSSGRANLADGAIERLVATYPSHSFVIDREEAKELFTQVRSPEGPEAALAESLVVLEAYLDSAGLARILSTEDLGPKVTAEQGELGHDNPDHEPTPPRPSESGVQQGASSSFSTRPTSASRTPSSREEEPSASDPGPDDERVEQQPA